ncbi:MAG: cyclase family protein [Halobacteriales archaeon]|nr:cyclase family protein [Halobacteriales archaeon]
MRFRDLSIPVDENTVVPPGLPSFRQGGVRRNDETDGYESDYITSTIHVGTHVDAPFHFDPNGEYIGDIELESLVRPTVRADVRGAVTAGETITLETIRAGLPRDPDPGEYLFVHTGWADDYIDDTDYYLENPYYEPAVSQYVVDMDCRGLITDTPIDAGHEYPNHFTLCENGKVIVENVANLEGLADEFVTWVVPIKLARGEGAPARVFLVEEWPR